MRQDEETFQWRSKTGRPQQLNLFVSLPEFARHSKVSVGSVHTSTFRRLGVDVTFPRIEAGGQEVASGLREGDWEFWEIGMSPAVQAVLEGHDTVILLAQARPHVQWLHSSAPRYQGAHGSCEQTDRRSQ